MMSRKQSLFPYIRKESIIKLLQCYSKGDRRFSAMYAKLTCGLTIEQVYQSSKRDEYKRPYSNPKEVTPTYLYFNQQHYLCTPERRHLYYTMLWECYFKESRWQLLEEAARYEGFYEWQGSEIFTPTTMKPEEYIMNAKGCNQAFSIAWHVGYRQGILEPPFYPDEICQAYDKYWKCYHPEGAIPN